MVVRSARRLGVGLVALAIACGGESGEPPGESLDGREFVSESIEGRELVPDTAIRIGFDDGELGAQAGCNSMFGPYAIEDGALQVAGLGSTEIGCDLPLHAQDEWLAGFLTSKPAVMLEEPRLTLTGSSERIVFLDRELASPDRPLVATNWVCDAVGDGESVSSVFGADGTIAFQPNGEVRVFTSCELGTGTYSAADTTITFASLSFDGAPCSESGFVSISEAFLFVFDGSPVAYELDERQLVIRRGGRSLYFRAAE